MGPNCSWSSGLPRRRRAPPRAALDGHLDQPARNLGRYRIGKGGGGRIRLSRIQGLHAYLFCTQLCLQSYEACSYGKVKYYTEGRQLRLRSGGNTERTMFLCTIGAGLYVGTFKHFFKYRFARIDGPIHACVEERMLAHVKWFPQVKIIIVQDRKTSGKGYFTYVPLDEASWKKAREDPEIVIDLKNNLNFHAATLLYTEERQTRRGRYLYSGIHQHPDHENEAYIDGNNSTAARTRSRGLVHKRGYVISKAHS